MVEQDAITGVNSVGLTVIDDGPVSEELGHGVRTARVKRRGLALRSFLH